MLTCEALRYGSEFVPVFSPDTSPIEHYVTLYDANRCVLRLSLEHVQVAQQVFEVLVYAPYWLINRCGLPIEIGQKWTASNVTLVGGALAFLVQKYLLY